jgi:hypothetical protein
VRDFITLDRCHFGARIWVENGYSFKEFSSFQITGSILLTNLIFHKTGSEKPGSSRGGATTK